MPFYADTNKSPCLPWSRQMTRLSFSVCRFFFYICNLLISICHHCNHHVLHHLFRMSCPQIQSVIHEHVVWDKLRPTIIFSMPSVKWISWYISGPFGRFKSSFPDFSAPTLWGGLRGEMRFRGLAKRCCHPPPPLLCVCFYVNRSRLGFQY